MTRTLTVEVWDVLVTQTILFRVECPYYPDHIVEGGMSL